MIPKVNYLRISTCCMTHLFQPSDGFSRLRRVNVTVDAFAQLFAPNQGLLLIAHYIRPNSRPLCPMCFQNFVTRNPTMPHYGSVYTFTKQRQRCMQYFLVTSEAVFC